MTNRHTQPEQRFPVLGDRARKMRWAYIPLVVFLALFATVLAVGYDFTAALAGDAIDMALSLGPIAGVLAVIAGLAWNIRRRIPRRFDGAGLVISPEGISIDYGNGPVPIDLTGVTGIEAVAPQPGKTPEIVVLCKSPGGTLTRWQRNWMNYRAGRHIARVHRVRQQDVLPLALLGEDRATEIVAALRARLESETPRA